MIRYSDLGLKAAMLLGCPDGPRSWPSTIWIATGGQALYQLSYSASRFWTAQE